MKTRLWGIRMLCACMAVAGACTVLRAEEVTIALTGQTHALLSPCHCPIEPDGGIARRATLLKQLRKKHRNLLVIDSGSFFAGGQMDQNSLGMEMDKQRTRIQVKAMDAMQFDAAAVGDDEFNFGRKFLEETIAASQTPFLSANVGVTGALPYLIKKSGPITVGVCALSSPAVAPKTEGLNLIDPRQAARTTIEELKKKGVGLIVLVSGLTEQENKKLIEEIPQIALLIEGATFAKETLSRTVGGTTVVAPRWEGRRLVTIAVKVKNNRVLGVKTEDIRLSDALANDSAMLALLPKCFSAQDCKKEGAVAVCNDPGTPKAACSFTEAAKVSLLVLTKPDCRTCSTKGPVEFLKRQIPGLVVTTLNVPSAKADALIKELEVRNLPAYFLAKEVENEKAFEALKANLEPVKDYFKVKPQVAGIGFFLHRPKIKDKVDAFVSVFHPDTAEILDNLKEFNPEVHFLLLEHEEKFLSPAGESLLEVEESLRAVCVQKYHPGLFYNYVRCRSANAQTAWWEDCLPQTLDTAAVRRCARSEEGRKLLRANIALGRELEIANGPTYLLDNEEIFGSAKAPKKEEFRKIILQK